jgi:AraC-type DNA-binding domain-containing proteins
MALLYSNEHIICQNHAKKGDAVFERESLKKGEKYEREVEEASIIFIIEGSVSTIDEADEADDENIRKAGEILLIPPVHQLSLSVVEDTVFIVFTIKSPIHLCNVQPLEKLLGDISDIKEYVVSIQANDTIKDYLNLLSKCLDDGLKCKCFAEIKSKEIFYYFRAYYDKQTLRAFFAPLFTEDYEFSVFVLRNYKRMKTVQRFAEELGYSLSKFERQFKRVFQESPYQWMTKQKSKLIYNDLVNTNMTLIEIADGYEFSSLSQLCDFCKRVLGSSPAKIRNSRKCKNSFAGLVKK